ncbi:MAG: hypothetical protein RXN91_10195 [Caldivirga sp.]
MVGFWNPMKNQATSPFTPPDQQRNKNDYSQYGVFWLCNWFQPENNNIDVFLLMNGNIFNHPPTSKQYNWNGRSAYATPPNPPASPGNISTITGKPLPTQSYINAYNTAFNQSYNLQNALYKYTQFNSNNVNSNFIPGTFGYDEQYNNLQSNQFFTINTLQDDPSVYYGTPYLFVSVGSGGGSGFMYLNWIIVTYGVPYVVSVS